MVLITLAGIALILALEVSWAEVIADTGHLVALIIAWSRERLAALFRRRPADEAGLFEAPTQAVLPPAPPLPRPEAVAAEHREPPQASRPPAPAPALATPPAPTSAPAATPAEAYVTDALAGHTVRWQLPAWRTSSSIARRPR